MGAVPTVQMEAMRLLRGVPKTAPRDTSNATVANASGAVRNATGIGIAMMAATKQQVHVGQTVRTLQVAGGCAQLSPQLC